MERCASPLPRCACRPGSSRPALCEARRSPSAGKTLFARLRLLLAPQAWLFEGWRLLWSRQVSQTDMVLWYMAQLRTPLQDTLQCSWPWAPWRHVLNATGMREARRRQSKGREKDASRSHVRSRGTGLGPSIIPPCRFRESCMAAAFCEGLGTTAAKTSFFGSLQAVVCAGTFARCMSCFFGASAFCQESPALLRGA